MKTVDGAFGEGGGQILRSSMALAVVTQTPVEVVNIRARRKKPGLLKQHLCAVKAAAAVCDGDVEGAELGSRRVVLHPGVVRGGEHRFSVGSAGSAALVLQTVLPPLLVAPAPSRLVVEGGTHNPAAPPFEFLERVFVPLMARLGARVEISLERAGFYPTGGGRLIADVQPAAGGLAPLTLLERGALVRRGGLIVSSGVPAHVARREEAALRAHLGEALDVRRAAYEAFGPGNAVLVDLELAHARAVFVGHGARGKPAEAVAAEAAEQAQAFLRWDVPVDEHLADQLLLPMAMGGGGAFRTGPLSRHALTNIEVVRSFLPVRINVTTEPSGAVLVQVDADGSRTM